MKLLKSFYYAFCGLWYCIRNERNFRIHITAIVTVLTFSYLYGLPKEQYPVILLVLALVPGLEAINTAVEKAVDTATCEKQKSAKAAKDAAAAGVLIGAIGAIVIAFVSFSDAEKWMNVIELFASPWALLGLVAYIVFFSWFVFGIKEKE